MEPAWDKERIAPSRERRLVLQDAGVDQRHDQLRGAAAHVAPARGKRVGGAHHLSVEHARAPELTRHEVGQRKANEQTDGDEAAGVGDQGHAEHAGRGQHQCGGDAEARAKLVHEAAHEGTRRQCAAHRRDAGIPQLELVQVQVVPDDRYQGLPSRARIS